MKGCGDLELPLHNTYSHCVPLSGSTARGSGSTAPVLHPGRRPSSTARAVVQLDGKVVPLGAVVPFPHNGSTAGREIEQLEQGTHGICRLGVKAKGKAWDRDSKTAQ